MERAVHTQPFAPWATRYRAAQRRLLRAYGSPQERLEAARCFARSVDDLRGLGLSGNGLLIAAEHMTHGRLRRRAGETTPAFTA